MNDQLNRDKATVKYLYLPKMVSLDMTEQTSNEKFFSYQQLHDKAIPKVSTLLSIGFEYLLANVAEVYSQVKGFNSLSEFNEKNKLERPLLLSYPFFISLSNGNRESLFNLYGDFLSYTYGPASEPIKELIPLSGKPSSTSRRPLRYFNVNKMKVEITSPNNYEDFKQLKESIKNENLNEFDFSEHIKFSDIEIMNDECEKNLLTDAIENGVEILKKKTNSLFFDGNTSRLIELGVSFNAWLKNYNENIVDRIVYDNIKVSEKKLVY